MKITIEYGHVYFGEAPYIKHIEDLHDGPKPGEAYSRQLNTAEMSSFRIGSETASIAKDDGYEVRTVVMVDDVVEYSKQHEARHGDDSARWILFRQRILQAAKDLLAPDKVVSEGELYFKGLAINSKLDARAKLLGQAVNGSRITVSSNIDGSSKKIKTRGFKDIVNPHWPSCDVLDLTFKSEQAQESDVIITILPLTYEEQQQRVNALAKFLVDPKLQKVSSATVFIDEIGQPCKIVVWNDPDLQAQELFKSLETQLVASLSIQLVD